MRALPDRVRAFVAIRMNAATAAAITSFVEELRERGAGVAWVRSANLHLTLRFLGGAVPAAMLAPLDHALSQIGARTTTFQVRACGTGAFPNLERPRVLWIGLREEPLKEVAGRVEAAARKCDLPRMAGEQVRSPRIEHFERVIAMHQRDQYRGDLFFTPRRLRY